MEVILTIVFIQPGDCWDSELFIYLGYANEMIAQELERLLDKGLIAGWQL